MHNRLVRVESSTGVSVSYAYDAQNHRVKREGKDGTTVYAYGRNGALPYQKNLTSGLERSFTYLGSTLLGWTETVGGESHKFFAVTDALGSVTQIRDEENNVVWDGEYAPFGTLTAAVGKKRFDSMFTGKDIDPETGLTYHWHRWRSEDGASFISEDPARDGINWYGYVAANPLRWIDPTGLYHIAYDGSELRSFPDDPPPGGWGPTYNGSAYSPSSTENSNLDIFSLIVGLTRDKNGQLYMSYNGKLGIKKNTNTETAPLQEEKVAKEEAKTDTKKGKDSAADPAPDDDGPRNMTGRNISDRERPFDINSLAKQNDIMPDGKDPAGPCAFMTDAAAAQIKARIALSAGALKKISRDLMNRKKNGKNVIERDWRVNNHAEVILEVLKVLGYPNASVIVGEKLTTPDTTADFNHRRVKMDTHSQLGNNFGVLNYEPYRYDDPTNAYTGLKADTYQSIKIILGERE